jgi:hypothetical protein
VGLIKNLAHAGEKFIRQLVRFIAYFAGYAVNHARASLGLMWWALDVIF